MKKLIIIVLVALLTGVSSVYAQRNVNKEDRTLKHLEKMDELLNLTDEQKSQMETLFSGFYEEMIAMRENQDLYREEKWKAMEKQHDGHMEKISQTLTEEQFEIFKEHQAEMKEQGKRGGKHSKKIDAKMKAFILEKRVEFDSELSEEEKETIAVLRSQSGSRRAEREENSGECIDRETRKSTRKEHRKTLKPLIEIANSHQASLQIIQEEIMDEMGFSGHIGNFHHRSSFARQKMDEQCKNEKVVNRGVVHFLLMDPQNQNPADDYVNQIEESFNIYPNPVTTSFTVEFNLQEEGMVSIELLNKYGGVLEVLNNSNCHAGINQLTFNANYLAPGDVYLVKVSKPGNVVVNKFIKL